MTSSYQNKQWRPLLDNASKPYPIRLLFDADDSIATYDQHWLRPVALEW